MVLVLAQAGFEAWRASAHEPSVLAGRVRVRQRMGKVINSSIAGVRRAGGLLGTVVGVKQRMDEVRDSDIRGVDGADGPDEQRPDRAEPDEST
ncbi:hypothetical protein [Saccharothrix sp. ALI-22-I]|uniref:hypothetical protein n=1 Tax=Saccharothrix sp. ALI-22-I TaxID=1933778 RepID=UPI00117A6B25|nr:hypothetical protein [Saccharothrix sp. ALI-22-I]